MKKNEEFLTYLGFAKNYNPSKEEILEALNKKDQEIENLNNLIASMNDGSLKQAKDRAIKKVAEAKAHFNDILNKEEVEVLDMLPEVKKEEVEVLNLEPETKEIEVDPYLEKELTELEEKNNLLTSKLAEAKKRRNRLRKKESVAAQDEVIKKLETEQKELKKKIKKIKAELADEKLTLEERKNNKIVEIAKAEKKLEKLSSKKYIEKQNLFIMSLKADLNKIEEAIEIENEKNEVKDIKKVTINDNKKYEIVKVMSKEEQDKANREKELKTLATECEELQSKCEELRSKCKKLHDQKEEAINNSKKYFEDPKLSITEKDGINYTITQIKKQYEELKNKYEQLEEQREEIENTITAKIKEYHNLYDKKEEKETTDLSQKIIEQTAKDIKEDEEAENKKAEKKKVVKKEKAKSNRKVLAGLIAIAGAVILTISIAAASRKNNKGIEKEEKINNEKTSSSISNSFRVTSSEPIIISNTVAKFEETSNKSEEISNKEKAINTTWNNIELAKSNNEYLANDFETIDDVRDMIDWAHGNKNMTNAQAYGLLYDAASSINIADFAQDTDNYENIVNYNKAFENVKNDDTLVDEIEAANKIKALQDNGQIKNEEAIPTQFYAAKLYNSELNNDGIAIINNNFKDDQNLDYYNKLYNSVDKEALTKAQKIMADFRNSLNTGLDKADAEDKEIVLSR